MLNSKKKRGRKDSSRQLTFSNPNYNGADYQMDSGSGSTKSTIWKRFKYDKAQVRIVILSTLFSKIFKRIFNYSFQDRVYEEKVLGPESSCSATPSPMPSHSGILPTIG